MAQRIRPLEAKLPAGTRLRYQNKIFHLLWADNSHTTISIHKLMFVNSKPHFNQSSFIYF